MDSSGIVNDHDSIKKVLDERGYEPIWGKPREERLAGQVCPRRDDGFGVCGIPCDKAENCYFRRQREAFDGAY